VLICADYKNCRYVGNRRKMPFSTRWKRYVDHSGAKIAHAPRKYCKNTISVRELKSVMLDSEINKDIIVKVEKGSLVPSTSQRSERVKKSKIRNPNCEGQEKKNGRREKMTEGAANFDPNDRGAAAMKLVEGTELKPADLTEILAAYKNGVNVLTSADPKPNDKVRLEHPKVEESAGPGPSKPSDGFN
jgi:hypothetical protein